MPRWQISLLALPLALAACAGEPPARSPASARCVELVARDATGVTVARAPQPMGKAAELALEYELRSDSCPCAGHHDAKGCWAQPCEPVVAPEEADLVAPVAPPEITLRGPLGPCTAVVH